MKKTLHLLTPLWLMAIIGLSLNSCKFQMNDPIEKKPPQGHVIETGTGAPIAGAQVFLSDCEGTFPGNLNCVTKDVTFSDSNGKYAFTQSGLLVNASKAGYFSDDNTSAAVLSGNEEQTDIVLPPYAWLEVTMKNESGAYAFNTDVFDSTNPYLYIPNGSDTSLYVLVRGNQDYRFGYCIKPDSITLTGCNWITTYCSGHDTTNITITF